jgi:hypothetical protein
MNNSVRKSKISILVLQVDWFEAMYTCNTMDMKLARFDSNEEQAHILSIIGNSYNEVSPIWLAGNDVLKEGNWRWAPEDSPVHVNLRWSNGQPTNNDSENCLSMHSHAEGIYLHSDQCTKRYNFICQK